jgi:hypothetical protein
LKKKKFEDKIKDLNSVRAIYQREFQEIKDKHKKSVISDKGFERRKKRHEKRIEKIRRRIHALEKKIAQLQEP